LVATGESDVAEPLLAQLMVGGRLVIPVGTEPRLQKLLRIRRVSVDEYRREDLGAIRFVPLVSAAGPTTPGGEPSRVDRPARERPLAEAIAAAGEPIDSIKEANLDSLLERIGEARVVLLGEASHGTAEFYQVRARITQELIERRGFTIVAVEADWPDAATIDRYVRHAPARPADGARPFSRFPTWMWANAQVLAFIQWLRQYNEQFSSPEEAVGFYGLDLYSLHASIAAVLNYLEEIDPDTAKVARLRYGCLSPWEKGPATYGAATLSGRYHECEPEVLAMLQELLNKQLEYAAQDGHRFLDAVQNARLVTNAERYYRLMYYGSHVSWNLRDRHMFETLESILKFRGPESRAVVWEHNSHIGDASATEMGGHGQFNVGQLCRERFSLQAYLVGFGTDHGTVAAASDWGGPMEIKRVRPALPQSYERLCHDTETPAFLLALREPADQEVRRRLLEERLERAIGVIYRPETELQSHYFFASLPRQFDEYIWFDETRAVTPLKKEAAEGMPDTFPFGL
ncbi:MAG: erythromycin esterase family protein, partial [Chloroflexi bacterium]|nr:erythromycin esterase family protein [Chloroflexota bacterium]